MVRRGHRCGGALLVAHVLVPTGEVEEPTRAGLVVSKAVGPAVTRTKVKRRLRHLVREHLAGLPGGTQVVLRAQPGAAQASYADLGAELTRCLDRSLEHSG